MRYLCQGSKLRKHAERERERENKNEMTVYKQKSEVRKRGVSMAEYATCVTAETWN